MLKMLALHPEIISNRKWTILPNVTVIHSIIKIDFGAIVR